MSCSRSHVASVLEAKHIQALPVTILRFLGASQDSSAMPDRFPCGTSSQTTAMKGKEVVGLFWREQGWKGERHPRLALQEDPGTDHRGPWAKGEHGAQS